MPVFRDVSNPSILIGCTECPWWFAMRFDRIDAYKAGERHEIDVHDVEPARAANPRMKYEKRTRHAVKV